jgi:organic radical activating enzyme
MSQIPLEKANLVVITDGEPLMWDLSAFLNELISNGFSVALETNGTLTLKKPNFNFLEYDKTYFEVIRPIIFLCFLQDNSVLSLPHPAEILAIPTF